MRAQGQRLDSLYVPLSGTFEVRVEGVLATTIAPYTLIGEACLLDALAIADGTAKEGTLAPAARATVVAAPGAKWARWSHDTFVELQQGEGEGEFKAALQTAIARTLSAKLGAARREQQLDPDVVGSGGEGASDGARDPSSSAQAEVRALLQRSAMQDERIASLNRQLAESERQRKDFAGVVTLSIVSLLGALGFASASSLWAEGLEMFA